MDYKCKWVGCEKNTLEMARWKNVDEQWQREVYNIVHEQFTHSIGHRLHKKPKIQQHQENRNTQGGPPRHLHRFQTLLQARLLPYAASHALKGEHPAALVQHPPATIHVQYRLLSTLHKHLHPCVWWDRACVYAACQRWAAHYHRRYLLYRGDEIAWQRSGQGCDGGAGQG